MYVSKTRPPHPFEIKPIVNEKFYSIVFFIILPTTYVYTYCNTHI